MSTESALTRSYTVRVTGLMSGDYMNELVEDAIGRLAEAVITGEDNREQVTVAGNDGMHRMWAT